MNMIIVNNKYSQPIISSINYQYAELLQKLHITTDQQFNSSNSPHLKSTSKNIHARPATKLHQADYYCMSMRIHSLTTIQIQLPVFYRRTTKPHLLKKLFNSTSLTQSHPIINLYQCYISMWPIIILLMPIYIFRISTNWPATADSVKYSIKKRFFRNCWRSQLEYTNILYFLINVACPIIDLQLSLL